MPVLFLDANVLLPQYLRSTFFDLADAELARVHWTARILDEVRRNLLSPRKHFNLPVANVDRLFARMNEAFPDAIVTGYGASEARFEGQVDLGDRHVAAGAYRLSRFRYNASRVVLVTMNTKHLPRSAFVGTEVRPARPGTVLKAILAANAEVANVLANMIARFKQPAITQEDLLSIYDASNCSGFATALGRAWSLTRGG